MIYRALQIVSAALWTLSIATIVPLSYAQEQDSSQVLDGRWLQAFEYRTPGPSRGGRVTAVAGYPGKNPVLYMGATGGGVWKSYNHGLSYENVSDGYFAVGSIGSIAIASADSNVVYVGTGSAGIRSNVSTGRGVYKSLDAGETWLHMGLPEAGQIGSLAVHPLDPNTVYVAALGHAFGPNPDRGIYRSYDGGSNWEQVLYVSDSTGAASVAINPQNPDEIYASMWRAERKPWTIISGSEEGGLYKSTDAGDTWTQLTEGLPSGIVGKIDVSLSPTDPERIYALIEAPGDSSGLYRSDNAGASFAFINDQKSLTYRPFYYTHVHADPADKDVVYVSNEAFYKSVDGGATFQTIRTPHGDHHDLWINPTDPDYLFQGNDGGATVSTDGGRSWSSILNQFTAEMYHVVVDNQHPYWLYGEQQDNTTLMIPSVPPVANQSADPRQHWRVVAGCETGPIAVHPDRPHIVYGGCKGRFSRYNHHTGQEKQYWVYPHFNYGHAAYDMPFRFQRTAPIELSPHNPNVIYHASQFVHKTTNEGANWEVISPDLTAFEPGKQGYSGQPITRDITGEEIYSAIYQLRESPLREGVLWAGSNDGLIHVSKDGGDTWDHVTPPTLPAGGRVQTIDPSPHRSNKAYIAVYRYMLDDWKPYVYRTEDLGETWTLLTDSTSGIPMDHPTRVVREDPDREGLLYVGTEFGLFLSLDDGEHWHSFQQNLPATPVTDIRVHRKDLVLSTMGRSFWIMDDLSPLHHIELDQLDVPLSDVDHRLFTPRDVYRYRWGSSRQQFDGATPQYPRYGAFIDYFLNTSPDPSQPFSLEIADDQGRIIRSFTDDRRQPQQAISEAEQQNQAMHGYYQPPAPEAALPSQPGLNRFTWNLRHPGPETIQGDDRPERGPLVAPGMYTATLRVGDWTSAQSFNVRMDPRVAEDAVTPADLQAQTMLSLRIRDRITELRRTVKRIRALRTRLVAEIETTNGEDRQSQISPIIGELHRIEEALVQTRKGKIGAQHKPAMMRQFTYLYGMLMVADQAPGEDAYVRLDDLELQLQEWLQALENLEVNEIAPLNIASFPR